MSMKNSSDTIWDGEMIKVYKISFGKLEETNLEG
jgi:hypothetical protein